MTEPRFPILEIPTHEEILKEVSVFDRTIAPAACRALNTKKREFDMAYEVWKAKKEDKEIVEKYTDSDSIDVSKTWTEK